MLIKLYILKDGAGMINYVYVCDPLQENGPRAAKFNFTMLAKIAGCV